VLVLLGGHFAYLRKEATGSAGVAARTGGSAILWIIIGIVILLFLVLTSLFGFRTAAVRSDKTMEMRERQMQAERMQPPPVPSGQAGHGPHRRRFDRF